jgi:hypothetical protein
MEYMLFNFLRNREEKGEEEEVIAILDALYLLIRLNISCLLRKFSSLWLAIRVCEEDKISCYLWVKKIYE